MKRYHFIDNTGLGASGTVYRAYDRLAGEIVAIKLVMIPSSNPSHRTGLAREFQTLASLRHPNIITVLDYGFDANQRPFYTMTYLNDAYTIREVEPTKRIDYLIQLLQALAYLHQHGIVHRDLKPNNLLISQENPLKVVDFGLATEAEQAKSPVGTLRYMAPEVMMGQGASPASDLFAVGIIAYELFAKKHPFPSSTATGLLKSIMNTDADLSPIPPNLRGVIGRLILRNPEDRLTDAYEAMQELCLATDQTLPEESDAIRESHLEAAKFVGRETQLNRLQNALQNAKENNQGSAWLIGGESGVGKSRFLSEIRIQAMVHGFIVLRGHGVQDAGLPYHMWRDPLRRLLLNVEISDTEASIFQDIIPDIEILLQRSIPDVPEVSGIHKQQRLIATIIEVFRRLERPILLLMEDLHWMLESLEPLKPLSLATTSLPLVILGSYRDDERPSLRSELSGMNYIHLGRFTEPEISRLSESMIGDAAQRPEIIELLKRETEGNAFFLVEVMRALAEEAGHLQDIGKIPIPQKIFAGGVQSIIRQRLTRVPNWAQATLKQAAIMGRQIDLSLLDLSPDDREAWLTICANAVVLEQMDGYWQFVHDKLRETIIGQLPPKEIVTLHEQAAQAIEQVYPNNKDYASVLTEHWHMVGNLEKEVHHAEIAVEMIVNMGEFRQGKALIARTLGQIGNKTAYAIQQINLTNVLGHIGWNEGNYETAKNTYQSALTLAENFNYPRGIAEALRGLGVVADLQGDYDLADQTLQRALRIFRQLDDASGITYCLNNLGIVSYERDDHAAAKTYLTEALERCRALQDDLGVAKILTNLGILASLSKNFVLHKTYMTEALAIYRRYDERIGTANCLSELASACCEQEQLVEANRYLAEALNVILTAESLPYLLAILAGYARLFYLQGDYTRSAEWTGALFDHPAHMADTKNVTLSPLAELLKTAMDDKAFAKAYTRGQAMSLDELLAQV